MKTTETANLPGLLFHAQTTGGKYELTAALLGVYHGVTHYSASGWTSGLQSSGFGGNKDHTALMIAQKIHDSAFCDGIHYVITKDELGVREALKLATPGKWFPASLVNAAA